MLYKYEGSYLISSILPPEGRVTAPVFIDNWWRAPLLHVQRKRRPRRLPAQGTFFFYL